MKTILLVEDEMIIALGTSWVLEEAGYTVVVAVNGEVGLTKASENNPDLIITDYMMPRMDGLAMIRELRSRGVKVPIVLATAIHEKGIPGNPRRSYDAYLGKPYGDEALLGTIQTLLAPEQN